MATLVTRMSPLVKNSADKMHLFVISNAIFGIITCIMLVVALSYNYSSKEIVGQNESDKKAKYFKGMIGGTLVFAVISAMLGIWLILISQNLKKQCNTPS